MTLGCSSVNRGAASSFGRRYITCVEHSCSGLFRGVALRPRLLRWRVPIDDTPLLASHLVDHAVEPVELRIEHCAHDFRSPRAVAGEWLDAVVLALPVKSAGV